MTPCSVVECDAAVVARSVCHKHYYRLMKYGAPELTSPNRIRDEDSLTGTELQEAAGVTYRQIDYWTRVGLLEGPNTEPGSGMWRRMPLSEVDVAFVLGRLSEMGVMPRGDLARAVAVHVREHGLTGRVEVGPLRINLAAFRELKTAAA